jgi:N-acetylmuramoyl-L-alanine amidase
VRVGWVLVLFLQAAAVLAAPVVSTDITPQLRASLTPDYELEVTVKPHDGDAWSRLARRVMGDGDRWRELAAFNSAAGDKLTTDQRIRVPFALLKPQLQRQIVSALFPDDRATRDGWKHVVVGAAGTEGESLWKLAEWFTGDGANYAAVRKANPSQGLSTRKGDVIVVPKQLLTAAFGGGGEAEGQNAPTSAAEVRHPEDDPVERGTTDAHAAETVEAVAVGAPALTFERGGAEPYAVYRLQKGEALYSSVAIRFTGRVYSNDVGDVVERIVKFNGIADVAKIPVGYPVKIPMSLLLPEYRPQSDPARLAREAARRESAKLARRTTAKGLAGVHVILDAGHGGRDSGTAQDGLWESSYVYDVMCRVKRVLEKKTAAKVSITTKSKSLGYDVVDRDLLDPASDHAVLTSPSYFLNDARVGVHLRWYLANSIFRRALKAGAPKEKVVFLSIHADSLHPSLRGAMAYIPAERYVTGTYEKTDSIYLARAEVRERPVVNHSEKESLEAEGLSRELAESIIEAFDEGSLKVHPFDPVRDNVVRGGREWVPAIIRYNMVPTRTLLEICNLGNARDRELMKTRKYRQQVADAIYRGIVRFYEDREGPAPAGVVASRMK